MTKKPNILFIFSDQHSQQVAGCYGDAIARTPNLDALASEGVTFDNCYTPSPVCTPARMSVLTARHPHRQQVWTNDDMLSSEIPCYPHAVALAGYRPKLVGRLHALGPDQMHGFDERKVGDHSPNWPGNPRTGMGVLSGTTSPFVESVEKSGAGCSVYQLLDQDTAAAAVDTLTEIGQRKDEHPFFMTVGFMLPHAPYVASSEDFALFDGKVDAPKIPTPDQDADHPFFRRWREDRGLERLDAEETQRARTAYYALTYRLDCLIGDVIAALKDNGLDDNTLIVYASDHGDQIGERGLWWKHTFYDQSAKVPLIMRWPGVIPENERRSHLVSLLDMTATLVDAAGSAPLPNSDGRSLLPIIEDPDSDWDNTVFSEYCMDNGCDWSINETLLQRMIREGDWKLNYYHGDPVQLFNLADDPDETCDLAGHPKHAALVERLTKRVLDGWSPDAIAERFENKKKDLEVMKAWAGLRRPADVIRWQFEPEQNQLQNTRATTKPEQCAEQ